MQPYFPSIQYTIKQQNGCDDTIFVVFESTGCLVTKVFVKVKIGTSTLNAVYIQYSFGGKKRDRLHCGTLHLSDGYVSQQAGSLTTHL